jgi:two-component system nitrogen regulation response regulator NtrX
MALLVETFLKESAKQNRSKQKVMSQDALDQLCHYTWPGNVRELKNLIERLVIMVEKDVIEKSDVPAPYNPEAKEEMAPIEKQIFLIDLLKDAKKTFEREFIQRKLFQHNNNITKTAESIGVERSYLHKKLKSLNEKRPKGEIESIQI